MRVRHVDLRWRAILVLLGSSGALFRERLLAEAKVHDSSCEMSFSEHVA